MATKLGRVVSIGEGLPLKSHVTLEQIVTYGHVTYKKQYISPSKRPIATQVDRVVAYDKFFYIKSRITF